MKQRLKLQLERLYRALFPDGQSAFVVAASVFVGVFIAVMPTFGIALPLTVFATAYLRVPKGPGLIASFIATPPTLLFFFYPLAYLLGEKLTLAAEPSAKALTALREFAPVSPPDLFTMGEQAGAHVAAFLVGTLIVALLTAALVSAVCYLVLTRRRAGARQPRAWGPPTARP